LENQGHIIENEYGGIAVEQIQVKLVPTISEGIFFREHSYQQSVVQHTVQPETLIVNGMTSLPGLVIGYDFVPLTVHHSEGRENILVFLSSLISIVAGVFVTVGLVTGCLLHSASAVAKKVD
jgi:Endoplasmic reticulum vesicle transporter